MASLVRPSRVAFTLVAWLFVVCVIAQIYLAGLGVFDRPESFITHREFGYLFGVLTLVMLVLAVSGGLTRLYVGGSVLLLVLFALQSVFVVLWNDAPALAALHPLNGFVILIVALFLAWQSRAHLRGTAATG